MTDEEKRQFIEYLVLNKEMREMEEKGICLYLRGVRASADDIARECVLNERVNYHRRLYVDPESGTQTMNFEEDNKK